MSATAADKIRCIKESGVGCPNGSYFGYKCPVSLIQADLLKLPLYPPTRNVLGPANSTTWLVGAVDQWRQCHGQR